MAHPNEELVRNVYDAYGRGDLATLGELFADDVVWHVSAPGGALREHRGRDAVLQALTELAGRTGGFKPELHDVAANDEHAVVLYRDPVRTEDEEPDHPVFEGLFHIFNGKVAEFWIHPEDRPGEEFFS